VAATPLRITKLAMHPKTVQEIERAIDALTPQQRDELSLWFDQPYPRVIDDAGRLDNRINRAVADHKAGRTQPL